MSHPDNSSRKKAEILVAEDSPTQAEILRYILEKEGYRVTAASDGRNALNYLNGFQPALIISDIIMPEMSGYELCQKIKADGNTRDIQVILLTALSATEDVLKGLACGADSFITKPFNPEYLLDQVEKCLRTRSANTNENRFVELEIQLDGKTQYIQAEPQRIVSLLLSIYDAAILRNNELLLLQENLTSINENLEELVEERTAKLSEEITKRQHLQDELRVLSLHDSLTGLLNRRGFITLAEQHHRLALRTKQEFALVYMDLNDLKHINDTYGHVKGDQAIITVAQVMGKSFRDSDMLCRLGGDEFIALLADCDPSTARLAIHRFKESLSQVKPPEMDLEPLSISVGLAYFIPDQPMSITELLEKADADMYTQKHIYHATVFN